MSKKNSKISNGRRFLPQSEKIRIRRQNPPPKFAISVQNIYRPQLLSFYNFCSFLDMETSTKSEPLPVVTLISQDLTATSTPLPGIRFLTYPKFLLKSEETPVKIEIQLNEIEEANIATIEIGFQFYQQKQKGNVKGQYRKVKFEIGFTKPALQSFDNFMVFGQFFEKQTSRASEQKIQTLIPKSLVCMRTNQNRSWKTTNFTSLLNWSEWVTLKGVCVVSLSSQWILLVCFSQWKRTLFTDIECEFVCSIFAVNQNEFHGYSSIAFYTQLTNQAARCDTFHLCLGRVRLFYHMKIKHITSQHAFI